MEGENIMTIGIYKLTNTVVGLSYIGSSINIERRKNEHFSSLRCCTHYNKKLQRAVDTYGLENFTFTILKVCTEEELGSLEEYYIKLYDSFECGYNNTDIVLGSCMQTLSVRQKHWGPLHGGSKYSLEQISEAARLLSETTLTASKISEITKVDVSTIHYIVKGGHQWLFVNNDQLLKSIKSRISTKEFNGTVSSKENVLLCMKTLLEFPNYTFEQVADISNLSKETVSAISAGRQFKDVVLQSELADRANIYYSLGKLAYAKKFGIKLDKATATSIAEAIQDLVGKNCWVGRDILEKYYGISSGLARKVSELDEKLLLDMKALGFDDSVNALIKLRLTGKKARKVSPELALKIDRLLKEHTMGKDDHQRSIINV